MNNVINNIKGSFLPKQARKELCVFLWSNKPFRIQLINDIAKDKLKDIYFATGENKEPNADEIRDYIRSNADSINQEANSVLNDLAKQCLPGFDWLVIFKHIGIFAICVVPAIYILIPVVWEARDVDIKRFYSAASSLLFLVILFFAVIVALVSDSLRKK